MNNHALGPQEIAQLQQLYRRAQGSGQLKGARDHGAPQAVGRPGPNMMATLEQPNTFQRLVNGVPYFETDVVLPKPWMPYDESIAWVARDRVATFTNPTINQETPLNISFSTPAVVYALTGAVNVGADLNVGQSTLDTFIVQIEYNQGDKWQTDPALGSTILGTASRPRYIGRPGWRVNSGTTLRVRITPLLADLRVDIVLWVIETPGPGNIATD